MDTSKWQAEYEAFAKSERDVLAGKSKVMSWDAPKPKLSELLDCAHLAKNRPEIWELAVEKSRKTAKQRDADEDYRLTEICGDFTSWFQFKNGLRDHNLIEFSAIQNVLVEWASLGNPDAEIAKSCFNEALFIDDLLANLDARAAAREMT